MAETMPSSYHLWAWLELCLALTSCVWVSPLATNRISLSRRQTRRVGFRFFAISRQNSLADYCDRYNIISRIGEILVLLLVHCVCIWMTGSATFIDRSIGHYCSSAVGYFICDDQGGFNLIRQDRQAGKVGSDSQAHNRTLATDQV